MNVIRTVDATVTELDSRCEQRRDGRDGQVGLSDMAVKAVQELRKNGTNVSHIPSRVVAMQEKRK